MSKQDSILPVKDFKCYGSAVAYYFQRIQHYYIHNIYLHQDIDNIQRSIASMQHQMKLLESDDSQEDIIDVKICLKNQISNEQLNQSSSNGNP